eukprot:scpid48966/ scgid5083/ 
MYVVLCEPYKILQLTPAFPTGPYVPYRQRSVECELGFMHVSTHLLQKRSSVYHDSAACTTIQQRVPRFSSVYHDSAACTTIQQRAPRFSSMYNTIPHRKKTSSPEDESKTNEAQKIEEDRSEKTERGKK